MNTNEHLRLFFETFAHPQKKDRYLALLDTPKGLKKLLRERYNFELDSSKCKQIPPVPGYEVFQYLQEQVRTINPNLMVNFWPDDDDKVSKEIHFSELQENSSLIEWGTLIIVKSGKYYIYISEIGEYICTKNSRS